MQSIQVLLIEDDLIDQQAVSLAIKEAHLRWQVTTVISVSEARQLLVTQSFDVILADYRLGDGTPLDLLTAYQTPMIVVTGFGDEEIALQALRAGAYDYLTKDYDGRYLKVLPVVVESVLRRHRLETDEREQRTLAAALRDTALALTSTLELNEVLERILSNVQRVVPHDRACIILVEDEEARIVQCSDTYPACIRQARHNVNQIDHLRLMVITQKPCLFPDVQPVPGQNFFIDMQIGCAYLAAPIITSDEVIGFISLESEHRAHFKPIFAERLQAFAAQAAVAIENARLYQQSAELAALRERQHIARDLHDSVTQTLFSAATVADAAITLWRQDHTQIEAELLDLHHLTRGALAEMRTLLFELRPDVLASTSLRTLLQQLLETLAGRTHIEIEFNAPDHDPGLHLPPDVRIALFRITQEALNNVAKHARARRVRLDWETTPDSMTLRVVDNGRGFQPSQAGSGHLGLSVMQERARNAGIECRVTSQPGSGTEVVMTWKHR